MSRSNWKGAVINNWLLTKITNNDRNLKLKAKNAHIMPLFIGHTIYVYNGLKYISLKITEDMVGHKIGEFIMTKKKAIYTKKKKKKK